MVAQRTVPAITVTATRILVIATITRAIMPRPAAPKILPPRTLSSAMFGLTSLWLCRICVRAGWLRNSWSEDNKRVFSLTRDHYVLPGRGQLCLGFRMLAGLAPLWCVWAWRQRARRRSPQG